jgi:hypothetical protein
VSVCCESDDRRGGQMEPNGTASVCVCEIWKEKETQEGWAILICCNSSHRRNFF